MVVEFARNVLGLRDAHTTEVNPNTPHPVVDLLSMQRGVIYKGGTMRLGAQPIFIKKDTLAHRIYGRDVIYERHRHRYQVNPKYVDKFESEGFIVSGVGGEGFPEIMASIMPCMWTYELIGDLLKDTLAASHRVYGIWVKEYCSQPYRDLVSKLKKILDDMEDSLTQGQIDKMREHFRRCSEFELKFWDMAYNWSSTSLSK